MNKNIIIMTLLIASGVYLNCDGLADYLAPRVPRFMTKDFPTKEEADAYNKKIDRTLLAGAALYGTYRIGSWAHKRWIRDDLKYINTLFTTIKTLSDEITKLDDNKKNSDTSISAKLNDSKLIATSIITYINEYSLTKIVDFNIIKKNLNSHTKTASLPKSHWYSRLYNTSGLVIKSDI